MTNIDNLAELCAYHNGVNDDDRWLGWRGHIDTRGGRKGFPFDVLSEFGRLREYYDLRVAPVKSNAWASIDAR